MIIKIKEGNKRKLSNPSNVAEVLRAILMSEDKIDRNKEHFWVIGATVTKKIIYVELVTLGGLSEVAVEPREVFRRAVLEGVADIILGHNHPAGSLRPSSSDIQITLRLYEAGKILGISVLDHVLISEDGYTSFFDEGLLPIKPFNC